MQTGLNRLIEAFQWLVALTDAIRVVDRVTPLRSGTAQPKAARAKAELKEGAQGWLQRAGVRPSGTGCIRPQRSGTTKPQGVTRSRAAVERLHGAPAVLYCSRAAWCPRRH